MKELTKMEGGLFFKCFHFHLLNVCGLYLYIIRLASATQSDFCQYQTIFRAFSMPGNDESTVFYSPPAHNFVAHKWKLEVKVQLHYAFHRFSSLNPTWVPDSIQWDWYIGVHSIFEPLLEIEPKVGDGCSFLSGHSFMQYGTKVFLTNVARYQCQSNHETV